MAARESGSTCERCFHQEQQGQLVVTQMTSERAQTSSVRFDELSLQATGPTVRRAENFPTGSTDLRAPKGD